MTVVRVVIDGKREEVTTGKEGNFNQLRDAVTQKVCSK